MKLLTKQKREGKRAITDADNRRWQLPKPIVGWVSPEGVTQQTNAYSMVTPAAEASS